MDNPPPTGELDHKMSVPVDNFRISAKATRSYRILWGKTPHKTIKGANVLTPQIHARLAAMLT
ncbi:hypothetical protein, partial [Corynebacterium diphtheriae]|uniref:hypothetical protein n=1 Tax=Corynebacterium diphtheriae TaxID=1717 RepID=UPI001A7E228D